MQDEGIDSFIARLRNVADEPKAARASAVKKRAKPLPKASPAEKPARRPRAPRIAPKAPRRSKLNSAENIGYLNALTPTKVITADGRVIVTSVQKLEEVMEDERLMRLGRPRRREPAE